ncbi:LruC domain-containing protein [Pedobacter cryophilus]|uniref:LruC domain-containing protein n=1 Tax=Pedobacter cryophilus TaxID=2571271 RepID=A0A4U1C0H1_9SPHI|nr:LruC domain-containing protein [Pedobacter cryophilus]TKB99002.1 LruC domain-containing protein [Pedobacter cryophilus]
MDSQKLTPPKLWIIGLFLITFLFACKKNEVVESNISSNKIAPDGFKFSTVREVKIKIRLLTNLGEPISGVPVTLNTLDDTQELLKMISDKNGFIITSLNVSTYIKELLVKTPYIGLMNKVPVSISSNDLELTLGGPKGLSGNIILSQPPQNSPMVVFGKNNQPPSTLSTNYEYMGTYSSNGRPDYLMAQPGNVSAGLLSYINASLPDAQDVRIHHPEYLAATAQHTLEVVETGEVFITFVAEGAGNLNSVGYYTYPTGYPPTTKDDISTIRYIFPNASDGISGGGLVSGDRVSLGSFNAGTTISIVLLSDAWESGPAKAVISSSTKFYTDKQYNPEPDVNLKVHSVLLNYATENVFVLGFEDLQRDNPACDQDFNDLVLYASANPVSALSKVRVKPLDPPVDEDGDGVFDEFDEYPKDPRRAYNTYSPSKYGWGTLAFEDNWPLSGDYDMNDLVLNYRYTLVSNANNNSVEMLAKFTAKTAFAQYKNGFGVKLGVNPSDITSVSGGKYSEGYLSFNANGTEANQNSSAVIIPFDNHKLLIDGAPNSGSILDMTIKFSETSNHSSFFSTAPFDPFLISNGRRGYEIHLPGKTPTNLANTSLFGTFDDRSLTPGSIYYVNSNNRPWAMHFNQEFKFPKEGVSIENAYLHFGDWAISGGLNFTDWYSNLTSGYRNDAMIYGN